MCLGRRSPTLSGDSTPDRVGLRCRGCGTDYPPSLQYACPNCLGPLDVTYDPATLRARLDRATIEAGPRSIWRYAELLPTKPGPGDLAPGFTPLVPAPRLAEALGIPGELYLKDDTRNPTNSFKDRVVAVAAARARAFGLTTLACASTGNLAGATAAAAAAQGMDCVVVIPADLEPAKIASAAAFGATVVAVEGNYDQANRLASQAAEAFGWGFVNVNLRPWYAEGSKTVGLEDPADGLEALEVVRSTGGRVEAISDDEVVEAIQLLARTTGVFGETAAGVTVATTARLATAGAFAQGERVVALVTGHGLKTREVLDGRAEATVTVRPNIDALEEALTPLTPELLVPTG